MAYLFESETCSRCHGTGEYSFCYDYGTRCFKCSGSKVVLTKRGAVAQRFLNELQTIPVAALQTGAIIEVTSITRGGRSFRYKASVVSVTDEGRTCEYSATDNGVTTSKTIHYVNVITNHAKFGTHHSDEDRASSIRVWPNTAENVAKALEYQANLTKTGTIRKRAK
jgi:hypothetical protein